MKAKRLFFLVLVFTLLCTMTAFADSDTYEGYPKANLRINNKEVQFKDGEVPAFVVNGSTVLPLRRTAELLGALIRWDSSTKSVNIFKPNINMFFAEDVAGKDFSIKKPFSRIDSGKSLSFVVFVQVDELKTNVDGFKIMIEDPHGGTVESKEEKIDSQVESFWYTTPFKVKFSESGSYTVKFAFLHKGEYTVVEQKTIFSE